mmetsp:Transcript_41301/g.100220  ORF Transcript_41301/g.100220 Transcript_41301/m.100220 type:complete len:396 (-) Transcript_41301:89-1276(-)
MPLGELGGVALGGVREALDGALAEEEAEHAADVAAGHRMARLFARLQDAVNELARLLVQLLVGAWLLEDLHRLNPRGHGERIARESSGLVHGPRGGNHLHDLLLARIRTDGQAAADHLAERGQVGRDAPVLLGAAVRDAEAGHHLVEDEESAVVRADLAELVEERLVRNDEAGVSDHALEDHAGDLAFVRLEERLDRLDVVVRRDKSGGRGAGGDARRVREAEGGHARAGGHEERVRVAVVAPIELDHLLPLGVRAHQPQHSHARLGARVGEADHLHGRDGLDHHLRQLVLQSARRAERRALVHSLLDRIEHAVVCVADDRRAPRADVVDVLVAVDIPRVCALDAVEDDGVAADGLEGAHRRGDTARHDLARLLHQSVGLGRRELLGRHHPNGWL